MSDTDSSLANRQWRYWYPLYSNEDVGERHHFRNTAAHLADCCAMHLCVQLGLCAHRGCVSLVNDAVGLVAQLPEASCWHFVMCGSLANADAQHRTAFAFSGRVVTAHHCDTTSPHAGCEWHGTTIAADASASRALLSTTRLRSSKYTIEQWPPRRFLSVQVGVGWL